MNYLCFGFGLVGGNLYACVLVELECIQRMLGLFDLV